jgi:hypothetical protein
MTCAAEMTGLDDGGLRRSVASGAALDRAQQEAGGELPRVERQVPGTQDRPGARDAESPLQPRAREVLGIEPGSATRLGLRTKPAGPEVVAGEQK